MKIIRTYCEHHLGDHMHVCHLLRFLALRHPELIFIHYGHPCYLPELICFTEDTPNFSLCSLENGIPEGAICTWKQHENFFASHPLRNDYSAFTKRHFRRLIRQFGLNDPTPGLLFDLPALGERSPIQEPYDVLFVNSNPCSGQFMDITGEDSLEPMAHAMAAKGLRVLTTKPIHGFACTPDMNLTCLQIAQTANNIPQLVGVSTGPTWMCFNTFVRKERFALLMIGNGEKVNLGDWTVNCNSIGQAMDELKKAGLV